MRAKHEIENLIQQLDTLNDRIRVLSERTEDTGVLMSILDVERFSAMQTTLQTVFVVLQWCNGNPESDNAPEGWTTLPAYLFKASEFLDEVNEMAGHNNRTPTR